MACVRTLIATAAVGLLLTSDAAAQPPAGVPAAIDKGVGFLRQVYGGAGVRPAVGMPGQTQGASGLGVQALAGLALLEGGAPPADPAVQNIARAVRSAILADDQTYHIALAVMFLDKLKHPGDGPLIQVLGVRLYAGMTTLGGWDYGCQLAVPAQIIAALIADDQRNRLVGTPGAGKERPAAPKGAEGFPVAPGGKAEDADKATAGLHPAAAAYYRLARAANRGSTPGDNSNTQFGLVGLWVAARNGVPADDAFAVVERRFLATQNRASFGWAYSGTGGDEVSPSMTCAGLLGLAVGAARGSGSQLVPKQPPAAAGGPPNDPFANPPKPAGPKANDPLPSDRRQAAVAGALRYLHAVLFARPLAARDGLRNAPGLESRHYLLWSLERVGVAYGLPTIGGVDWYEWGCAYLLPSQGMDGSWTGSYGPEVDTSFALLFLTRSNVVADLTSKIGGTPLNTELRAGRGKQLLAPPPGGGTKGTGGAMPAPGGTPGVPVEPAKTPADEIADGLVAATGETFKAKLHETRDAKGGDNTSGLVKAVNRLTADRQKDARDALAERLTRMTTATLRGMLRNEDAELRRAVCLAVAMKDDKAFIPDLIEKITDPADLVVRAARAGLKSLTGQDHGPQPNADDAAKKKAQADWRAATKR